MRRPGVVAACLLSSVLGGAIRPGRALAFCPSYQRGTLGSNHCAVESAAGTDPTFDEWKAFIELASQGPDAWGGRGPSIPKLETGCKPGRQTRARFPCELIGALLRLESSWHQFCVPTEPATEVGKPARTLITHDCGHGVAQVTSGMHEGEKPAFDQARVASDPFYNLAVGASILAAKWQSASCIGSQNPEVLEHWYAALWRYNGYSYSNDPSNPAFSSTRGVWDPAVGGDAPYQEKVFGIVEKGSLSGKRWRPLALAYPRIEDVAGRTSKAIGEPFCASPTDCVHRRTTHRTSCELTPVVNTAGDGGTASPDPGQRPPPAPAKKCGCSSGGEGGLGVALALVGLAVWRRRVSSGGR